MLDKKEINKIVKLHETSSIYTPWADSSLFIKVIDELSNLGSDLKVTKVIGVESRGFIFGSAVAYKLGVGFVPVRKKGASRVIDLESRHSLVTTSLIDYSGLEKGFEMEDNPNLIKNNDRILVVDDWFATGAHAYAVLDLVKKIGRGRVCGFSFVFNSMSRKTEKDLRRISKLNFLVRYRPKVEYKSIVDARVGDNRLASMINFWFEVGYLNKIPRCQRKNNPNSISEHSFRVVMIGFLLSKLVGGDTFKVLKMCLIHDLAEVRTGDLDLVTKSYTSVKEEKSLIDIIDGLDCNEFVDLLAEFNSGKTLESKLSRDADILEELLTEREQFDAGDKRAKDWMFFNLNKNRFMTSIALRLANKIVDTDSSQWWYSIVEENWIK